MILVFVLWGIFALAVPRIWGICSNDGSATAGGLLLAHLPLLVTIGVVLTARVWLPLFGVR